MFGDPLSPGEREEYEADLIAFSDRELDLLGDISGFDVLYAGGTSPLWIEGLALRIGECGSLTVLDLDTEGLRRVERFFEPEDLPLRPRFVCGDVFELPFESDTFGLAYSSGLLHELDVTEHEILGALGELARVVRPGGEVATSDFVSDVPAAQLEEEEIEADVARLSTGARLFGITDSKRLVEVHESALRGARWRLSPSFEVRHLERFFPPEPPGLQDLEPEDARAMRRRWKTLEGRISTEGYTRPATLFVKFAKGAVS